MPASADFRLSITRALGDQLAEALADLTPAALEGGPLGAIHDRPGVYQLFEDASLVYVGKAEDSLATRLRQHARKLSGRLWIGDMTFTCLYVDEDLHAVAPERLLIRRLRGAGQAAWNSMGFGNKDPGKERDTTAVKPEHFDAAHPINLQWPCENIMPGQYAASELLTLIKNELPYLFRYEAAAFHRDVSVEVRETTPTADELFTLLGAAITRVDARWQITALPGYVIMYPRKGPYPSAGTVYP